MNTRLTRILVAVLLSGAATPSSGQMVSPVDSSRGALEAPLAPGDVIQLAFWREPQLGGDFPVDESGSVVLPLLGVRTVAQRPASELKRALLDEYAQQIRNQEVRITLLRRVRILGAVKNPGLYHVDPTMSVVDALAMAGGATEQGKLKGVRVYRGGKQVGSPLDLNARLIPQLRSGDQIVVPERSWFARNGGYVVAAGISAVAIIVARVAP